MPTITESTPHWVDRTWAALIFFTRIPFYRLHEPPVASYSSVVEHWPTAGWVTGAIMAATLWGASQCVPYGVAVVMAVAVRHLTTGGLHEDGLADFFDGFGGGGTDRSRILTIMKDSHIGTYGVLGLIVYEMLLAATLYHLTPLTAAVAIIAADPYAKMVASQLVRLPYARTADEAKAKTVYRPMSRTAVAGLAVQGLPAMGVFVWLTGVSWIPLLCVPCAVMAALFLFIRRRLQGYTGDCCGAVCLMVELSVYIVMCSQHAIISFT